MAKMAATLRTEEVVIVNFDFDGPAKALAFHCCMKLVHYTSRQEGWWCLIVSIEGSSNHTLGRRAQS
jgi:hypothetical protein